MITPPRGNGCRWCGRELGAAGSGRRRRYCRQSCRQRAYEQRAQLAGAGAVDPDAVVLSAREAAALSDRLFQLRCAAEDLATAIDEDAPPTQLRRLTAEVLDAARAADGWR